MKIGEVFRYTANLNYTIPEIDGLPNFHNATFCKNTGNSVVFQKGIHPISKVQDRNGNVRIPAIIISSNIQNAGSVNTPWEDYFEPDFGHVRYYGDNKSCMSKPGDMPGNVTIINEHSKYASLEKTKIIKHATPFVFFSRLNYEGRKKGNIMFQGYGVIESITLITQYAANVEDGYFSNYAFDFCVFNMTSENEDFSWEWINARRNSSLTLSETHDMSPSPWKKFIQKGIPCLNNIRRRVSSMSLTSSEAQLPVPNSKDEAILENVFKHFKKRPYIFEYFALKILEEIFEESKIKCAAGWVTRKSSDGGIDFITRIDIGSGLAGVKIVVLGQAKCTDPHTSVNGSDISRTVARLKRGWMGAFVTTSYFTRNVQMEVIEDQYPIMMINGLRIAQIVQKKLYATGIDIEKYFRSFEDEYNENIVSKRPDEILYV